MAHRKTLTARQLDLLGWVRDGCPTGVVDGSYKISIAALRNRGLVTTAGRGRTWSAKITNAGRDHLERAVAPGAPPPRQGTRLVTEALIEDLINAGGCLVVEHRHYRMPGQVDWGRRIQLAEVNGKVPRGKRITTERRGPEELEICLVDAIPGTVLELRPVPVPDRLTRPHAAVLRLREVAGELRVSKGSLSRALRLIQALAVAAENRGFVVTSTPDPTQPAYGQRRDKTPRGGQPLFTLTSFSAILTTREVGLPDWFSWSWQHTTRTWVGEQMVESRPSRRVYETTATGQLTFELPPRYRGPARQSRWTDGKRTTLEQQLPEILRELEVRAAEHRHELEEARAAQEAARRTWDHAMEKARAAHSTAHLATVLIDEAERWHRAQLLRDYSDAAEESQSANEPARHWIAWARSYADSIDPLGSPLAPPSPPKAVSGDELRPFLPAGFNPYAPPN